MTILFSTVWYSCEKDINITEFENEFGDYEPELKVEGLLQQDKPEDSIIRIIKTTKVTDTELYNGRDDDGDGFIDDEDEILALVQDTSATVKVTNLNSGVETNFQYVAVADSSFRFGVGNNRNDDISVIPYGGYKPSVSFEIELYADYRIDIYSEDFDKTITGTTTVYPPVNFIDTLFTFNEDQVVMNVNDDKEVFWRSDLDVTSYYVTFEEVISELETEFVFSYIGARDNNLSDRYQNASVGRTIIFGATNPTVLKLTIEALSPEYGRYAFSGLPLNDAQRSNLRDENGIPVMGVFGASAARGLFVVIEE